MNAPVMTDAEFARFVGPHPLRIGDRIMRPKLRTVRFRRDNYEAREVGRHPGVVLSMEADGFIARWTNTGVRRWFRFVDEGRLWVRAPPPRVKPSPSPWVPPRRVLSCCGDRQYDGASHACTERTCTHLPVVGQTCADCVHVEKCTTMFGSDATDTACQFFPRRFRARAVQELAHA